MKRLRELCDKHGILLIADEVQTGAGRTGTFFAMEQMGVAADLTTFAKSIAGGFPLAGVCGKAEYMDAIAPGGLGGTYAGSPIACIAMCRRCPPSSVRRSMPGACAPKYRPTAASTITCAYLTCRVRIMRSGCTWWLMWDRCWWWQNCSGTWADCSPPWRWD